MLNPLQIGLLSLNVLYSSIGYLIYNYEKHIPAFVLRAVKYGAFTYNGNDATYMKKLNVPKHYYKHFYVFGSIINITSFIYMVMVYFCGLQINIYHAKFLHAFVGSTSNTSAVSVLASMVTLSLVILQCMKRLYEAYYVQVFPKSSNIYLTHYVGGWMYYLIVNVAIVGQAPLFCGDNNRDTIVWADLRTILVLIPGIPIFFWAWHEQHQSNLILANLRKDKKSGEVITDEHKIPHGRLFESISSPHRYCEIILYAVLFSIIQTWTFFCISLWVLCNQIQTAMLVHKWYKETFNTYPKDRHALFVGIM